MHILCVVHHRGNTSSRLTVQCIIGSFFNQMLHLVVKTGSSWKPVRHIFPGQICKNRQLLAPPPPTVKWRGLWQLNTFIPNCYKSCLFINTFWVETRSKLPEKQPKQLLGGYFHTCRNMWLLLQQQWPFLTVHQPVKHVALPIWCNTSQKKLWKISSIQQRLSFVLLSTFRLRKRQRATFPGCHVSRKILFAHISRKTWSYQTTTIGD